jgi:hypothetical protein
MNRQIRSTISRVGQEVVVKTRTQSGSNTFNNPTSTWTEDRTTQCVRTYPNRNSQFENRAGSYNEDRALFIFERSSAPTSGSRIVYDNQEYELKSPTEYDTHVAIFGEPVSQ